jgi:hypothetical protein
MMHRKYSLVSQVAALVALLFFTACDPEKDDIKTDPPLDGDPQVTLLEPASGYALARKGETVTIKFEIHDNELLNQWEAMESWKSVSGVTYLPETRITGQFAALSTKNSIRTISYTVPNTPALQVYTTITICGYATDNKGKRASACFRVNVIPDDNSSTNYAIQEYVDNRDTVWSITTGEKYAYDLINRRYGDNTTMPIPNQYIREASVPPAIDFVFTSPIWGNTDSVLVTTNASMFNFDELTYETMWEAFVTSNRIGRKTSPLAVGDVVILRMPNLPHFAAIRVNGISVADGRMTFDYKYSY